MQLMKGPRIGRAQFVDLYETIIRSCLQVYRRRLRRWGYLRRSYDRIPAVYNILDRG